MDNLRRQGLDHLNLMMNDHCEREPSNTSKRYDLWLSEWSDLDEAIGALVHGWDE